jgi:hypothetical protein
MWEACVRMQQQNKKQDINNATPLSSFSFSLHLHLHVNGNGNTVACSWQPAGFAFAFQFVGFVKSSETNSQQPLTANNFKKIVE